MPIHLAIARGHFFVVHHLLCQEQVVMYLMMMPYELYQCFKYAISNQSIQILMTIYRVFEEQIVDIIPGNKGSSFWELSTFNQTHRGLQRF